MRTEKTSSGQMMFIFDQNTENQCFSDLSDDEKIKSKSGGSMEYLTEDDVVKIIVIGVGGAGNNVVNRIVGDSASNKIHSYDSIEFVIVNTDKQALIHSQLENKVLIGEQLTKGQGAGADPEKGRKAAEESAEKLKEWVAGRDLVFITAGMGGGTGTGASPVIAKLAKEAGALVVAVVSTPFKHEGNLKREKALAGIERLKEFADALIIIDNNKLSSMSTKRIPFGEVFAMADEPLKDAILGIASVALEYDNQINTDFSDVRAIMENKGIAHMAVGSSKSDDGAGLEATRQALESNLTNTSIKGATGVVVKIQSSDALSFEEFNEMLELVSSCCDPNVTLIPGKHEDEAFGDEVRVTIIATGIEQNQSDSRQPKGLSMSQVKKPEVPVFVDEPKKQGLSIPKRFK